MLNSLIICMHIQPRVRLRILKSFYKALFIERKQESRPKHVLWIEGYNFWWDVKLQILQHDLTILKPVFYE